NGNKGKNEGKTSKYENTYLYIYRIQNPYQVIFHSNKIAPLTKPFPVFIMYQFDTTASFSKH
ncbi:MAG: hypothetical protein ACTTKO_04920, partial [Candidatus Limimorpha sp.]